MRLATNQLAAFAAACLLSLAAALAPATASAQRGGLSVDPGILEAPARPGGVGALKVSNTTSRAMRVRLAVRPWRQARSGSVVADRRRVLGALRPNRRAFWLKPGATRALGLALTRRPKRRSLYGAIEVTGAPKRRRGGGLRVAYRLVTSLRLFPPPRARRFRARPERLFQVGTARRGALFLAVRNAGNTIDPIGGRVRITGRGRKLSGTIPAKAILPGATVNLRLARLRGTLPRGRYRLGVRLTQQGRKVGGFRRGIRLR
jgi:hypothetical protein